MDASAAELTRSEYETLVTFAEVALRADHPSEWWEACAELMLGPLLHADVVAVACIDHRGSPNGTFGLIRPAWAEKAVPTGSEMHVDLIADHPLTAHLRGPRAFETVRVSDLISPSRWRSMAGHAKMRSLIGATHQMNITVRADRRTTMSTSPIRTCVDFTDHEVQVAERLKHLLQAADRHSQVRFAQRSAFSAGELSVRDAAVEHFGLTRREEAVLGLMADGLTAAATARALRISARTVSKHQENLYRKLQVHDRLAAVQLARRNGLLAPLAGPERVPTP